jgi:hypothetical protein
LGRLENFLLSVLAFHVVPLLPIAIELLVTGAISNSSLVITTAIYSAGMMATSRQPVLIGLYIIISILEISLFGALTVNQKMSMGYTLHFTIICLLFVLLSQLIERWSLHVLRFVPFWDKDR